MKKSYTIVAIICLLMTILISIKSPVNVSRSFVLNGNALSEDVGFEDGVGADFETNKSILDNTSANLNKKASTAKTHQNNNGGCGISLNIDTINLQTNVATNIGAEDEYKEPEVPNEIPEQKPEQKPTNTTSTNGSNILTDFNPEGSNVKYMGNFKLTAYCPCYECSEGYGTSTASGKKATANHTIAVDPKVIPYGTIVVIERNGVFYKYTAEDCGGAIKNKKIDIYFDTHSETTKFGVRYGNVYIITE